MRIAQWAKVDVRWYLGVRCASVKRQSYSHLIIALE